MLGPGTCKTSEESMCQTVTGVENEKVRGLALSGSGAPEGEAAGLRRADDRRYSECIGEKDGKVGSCC